MSNGANLARAKRLTALWYVVCVVSAAMLVPTLVGYDRRFGLPGFVEALGIPAGCAMLWAILFGPGLFFGMPTSKLKTEPWELMDRSAHRWGIVAMAAFFVVSAATTAALGPRLLLEPRAPQRR